jgi:hypothetical protein
LPVLNLSLAVLFTWPIEPAQAVVALREAGNLPPKLAAAGVCELCDGAGSAFCSSRLPSQSRYGPAVLALTKD